MGGNQIDEALDLSRIYRARDRPTWRSTSGGFAGRHDGVVKRHAGAGKTRLVRAAAAACGIANEQVVSPTFVLCQEYHGQRTLYHMDVYRIADDDEFLNLGPEECFESSGITFVEWAEKVVACLPEERIEVVVEVVSETSREFHFSAIGQPYEEILDQLAASCREST